MAEHYNKRTILITNLMGISLELLLLLFCITGVKMPYFYLEKPERRQLHVKYGQEPRNMAPFGNSRCGSGSHSAPKHLSKLRKLFGLRHDIFHGGIIAESVSPFKQSRSVDFIKQLDPAHLLCHS